MKPVRLVLVAFTAAVLAACASEPPREHFRGGHGGWGERHEGGEHGERLEGRRGLNLFISPEGEPFRGRPGEPYAVAAWFARADRNHDGRITEDEFRDDAAAFFRELDVNHDGVIDGVELARYETEVAPEILPRLGQLETGEGMNPNLDVGDPRNRGRSRGMGGRSRGRGGDQTQPTVRKQTGEPLQGASLYGLLNEPEPVADADAEFNNRITLAEFLAAAERRFEALDVKKRGYLTLADLPKTPVQQIYERAEQRRLARGRESKR